MAQSFCLPTSASSTYQRFITAQYDFSDNGEVQKTYFEVTYGAQLQNTEDWAKDTIPYAFLYRLYMDFASILASIVCFNII
jgi:hypothetical protein